MKLYIRDEDRYGIDVKKWAWEHEAYMKQHEDDPDPEALLRWHLAKTRELQHERLVHFLVTFLTVLAVMFDFALVLFLPASGSGIAAVVLIGLLVLLACYMYHYFVLENTVQPWYRIADRLHDRIDAQHTSAPHATEPLAVHPDRSSGGQCIIRMTDDDASS